MIKKFKVIMFTVALSIVTFYTADSGNPPKSIPGDPPQILPAQEQTITEPVKIVKIELATNTITVSNSYINTYVVDPQVIDLRRYQVGTKVTATLKVTTTTDRLTQIKSTKTQLVKLQR
jgi:hypothetical protein